MHGFYILLLAGGVLVFVSLLVAVLSTRLGLPFLLVFLLAGMAVGVDGPIGVRFDSPRLAAWVGSAALAMILLEGGISTRAETFRAGFAPAFMLASVGVALTAGLVGAVAVGALHVDWRHGLLLGAIVGSTDAAAVFSLLRQTGVRLGERIAATLELESGLNDPMAVFLVLALTASIQAQAGAAELLWLLVRQLGIGVLFGIGSARAVAWICGKLPLTAERGGVLALLIVSGGMAVFAAASLLEGSGFLAIYLYGVRLRARAEAAAHAAASALDGFAWAAQATMFLLLGLLVSPHDMLRSVGPTLAVAAALIFVARPLAVWLCLWPFGFGHRQRLFIGWVGLRGAVPIVLALFPWIEKVPDSYRYFNAAFAVVLASLLLQGTTLGWAARRLGMIEPPETPPPEQRAVQGRLTLDADLRLTDVFEFFQLPLPEHSEVTLREWMTDHLARGHVEGDGIEWHGAHFRVGSRRDGRIERVALALAPRAATAS
jgi:cell volume regulation protein A